MVGELVESLHDRCPTKVCNQKRYSRRSFFGYNEVIFKSDQEPAILEYMRSVKGSIGDVQVIAKHSPVGNSPSDGDIETAVQHVQGQYRTLKNDLESCYENKM